MKDLKSRLAIKNSKADKRVEALESRISGELEDRVAQERSERLQATDSMLLWISNAEEARAKLEAKAAIDTRQLEVNRVRSCVRGLCQTVCVSVYCPPHNVVSAVFKKRFVHFVAAHF